MNEKEHLISVRPCR